QPPGLDHGCTGKACGLAPRLVCKTWGFLRSHDARRPQTKNDEKQEAIASINELHAQAINEAAVHAIGKQ
ncbi:MAG: hypothetical protein WAL37_01575, partial [Xanthobacteraceae bacterium]